MELPPAHSQTSTACAWSWAELPLRSLSAVHSYTLFSHSFFPPLHKTPSHKRDIWIKKSHEGLVIGLEMQGNVWSSHSLSNHVFIFSPTCCYELSSFSDLPRASGEAARAKLSPQRPEILPDSFFWPLFCGQTRLAPSPTVVGNDFTSEVSIIIIEKFLPTAFCSSARPLHAVPSAGVTTACIHCALRVISDLL